jgi:hypothetical protein
MYAQEKCMRKLSLILKLTILAAAFLAASSLELNWIGAK